MAINPEVNHTSLMILLYAFWLHDERSSYMNLAIFFLFFIFKIFSLLATENLRNHFVFEVLILKFSSFDEKFRQWKKKQTLMPMDDDGRSEEAKERSVRRCCRGDDRSCSMMEKISVEERWWRRRRRRRPACLPACLQLASTTDHKTVIKFRLLAWSLQYFAL